MLPHLQWTPDWMEVYQAEEAPGLDTPAHEIVKSAFQDCSNLFLKHTNAKNDFYFGGSRWENIENMLP